MGAVVPDALQHAATRGAGDREQHMDRCPAQLAGPRQVGGAEHLDQGVLDDVLGRSGRSSSAASAGAREDFPLAGGPETTTNPRKAATYQASSAVGRSG